MDGLIDQARTQLWTIVNEFSKANRDGVHPRIQVAPKPEPISKPFDAGKLSIAFAKSASSLSKTGSPSPGGTPRTTQAIVPPNESPSARAF